MSFKYQPGKDFFAAGSRRLQFRDVTEQLKASYKAVKSQLDKQWNKEYSAKKLALLAFLIHREELERIQRYMRSRHYLFDSRNLKVSILSRAENSSWKELFNFASLLKINEFITFILVLIVT